MRHIKSLNIEDTMSNRLIIRERLQRWQVNSLLLMVILILVGMGVISLFSSSHWRAALIFDDPLYFFRRQLIWIGLGATIAYLLSKIELKYVENAIPWLLLGSVILLLLTFVDGIGTSYLGARRWLLIFGVSLQPSEVAKITLILYLALVLDRKADRIHEPWNAFIPPLVITCLIAGLVYLQNDFSSALFLLAISTIMLFIGGVPIRYFVGTVVVALPIALILLLSRAHRINRIISFLFPTLDPQGGSYQLLAAHSALGSGRWWGTGLGLSSHKLGELPEAHSDFVFAVIAEESGLVGSIVIIFLFLLFALQGLFIANHAKSRFGYYLAAGITISIVLQALANIAVICGIVPTTGIPLPFFSAGGSSMLTTLAMCGLLLNVSRFSQGRLINNG